jgi:hypothetical protein
MTRVARIAFISAVAASVAGCAIDSNPSAVVTPLRPKIVQNARAHDAVVAGTSTKADVIAALGATLAIRFDSGYEVWVYRLSENVLGEQFPRRASDKAWPWAPAEFVILFAPSGVVAKTRIRPAG